MLDPDAVAARTFGTSRRGYDPEEVRRFLMEVAAELRSVAAGVLEDLDDDQAVALVGDEAARLLSAARGAAAEVTAKAEERAAEVLREAQEEALRLRATVEAERDRALAEGAQRAEEALADVEQTRQQMEAEARAESDRLVAEAVAAREHVLRDLARRRTSVRAQVEQLHAAREKLLQSLGDVARSVEEARGRLVVALPEAKLAADAAARRVQGEPELTVEQLEGELDALRLAGLSLLPEEPAGEEPAGEEPAAAEETAAAAEAVVEAAAAEEPAAAEPEPEARRSSSVRVFRTRRDPTPVLGSGEPDLHPVEPNAPFEEVRVVPRAEVSAEEAATHDRNGHAPPAPDVDRADDDRTGQPEPEHAPAERDQPGEPEPERETEERLSTDTVDALFARLRAGREERTAAAEGVLAEPETQPAPEPEQQAERAPVVVDEVAVHVGGGAERVALLARRDELLAPPVAALTRRLKRLLADEQNAVLDVLRREGPRADFPGLADLADRWAEAARLDLADAAAAGAAFLGGDVEDVELDDVAAELAASVAAPLASRLGDGLRQAEGDTELAAESVRSTCREWRSRRLADGVEHAVRTAFGRGELAATPPGTGLCWVVDDGGSPCPDAEDNALAGVVPAGEAFPTGHRHPPAHPGCRCILARPL